ncbi:MAG: RNA-binding S4 domain-containing protein [Bacteroidales bacterium]|nr:RNA-binding S4 domain-containing protein [Bacteroidales bacterium]
MNTTCRIDKWLWEVRLYKTRAAAADACKNGRIYVNDALAKPSRDIKVGDTIRVRKPPVTFSFRALALPKGRLGAKLVPEHVENLTPPEELQKLAPTFMAFGIQRDRGAGRPTKKERRSLEGIFDPSGTNDDANWPDDLLDDEDNG